MVYIVPTEVYKPLGLAPGRKYHVESSVENFGNTKITTNTAWGDNSVSLRRIWTKHRANSSYKPPGASYTAQGLQKQPEIIKTLLLIFL